MVRSKSASLRTPLARAGPKARADRLELAVVTPIGSSLPVAETLPFVVDRIVRALDPEKIVLFGSYAYGDPNPHSDVDLLVVMATNAPPAQRFAAAR